MEYLFLILVVVLFIAFYFAVDILKLRLSNKMTYEKLITRCKGFIDNGRYDKVRTMLVTHPKLLLTKFNDIQVELLGYAREKDSSITDNN